MARARKNKIAYLLVIALLGLSLIPVAIHPARATAVAAPGYAVTTFASEFPTNADCGISCGPLGLAFDRFGNLFVTDIANGGLYKLPPTVGDHPASTYQVCTFPGNSTGLVTTWDGQLLASRATSQDIVKLNPVACTFEPIAKLPTSTFQAFGLAIDPLSRDLFASESAGGPIFRISKPLATPWPGSVTNFSPITADGIGFGTNGTLYAAADCGGVAYYVTAISGTNSQTPGSFKCLVPVYGIDGLAVSPRPGNSSETGPILFGNRGNGIITEVDLRGSQPEVTDIVTGGTRGDFATVGPDGCLYATQSNSVLKVTNSGGKCPFGGFTNASENPSSCPAMCSSHPHMATVNGHVHSVWLNNTSGNSNILFSTSNNNGSSVGPVVKITNSTTGDATNEQIEAVGSDVYVVWQQNVSLTNSRIFLRASTDNGTSFGPIVDLTSGSGLGMGTSRFPEVAAVGNNVYVTWLGCTDISCDTLGGNLIKILFRASTNNGSTFPGSPVTLSTTAYSSAEPQIDAVASFVYVAWSDSRSGRAQTFFASSPNAGNSFGTAFSLNITPPGETDLSQEMAVTGNNVYVTWTNHTSSSDNTMFAASTNNGGSFGVALNLNKGTVTDLHPELAASGTNVFVVWSDASGGNTEVLYRTSSNSGTSFGSLLNLSNTPGTSNQQMIAASGSNVYVTWIESSASNNGVYFVASSDSGSTFGTLFNLISDSVSNTPVVAGSGSYAYVAWEDGTTGNGDIYIVSGKPFSLGFSIANSGTIGLTQGSSGSNSISLAFISGTSQTVFLSCGGGVPSGASCAFNPIAGTPSFSSSLTISTQPSTPIGSYVITVTGAAGDLGFSESQTTQFTLVVAQLLAVDFTFTPACPIVGQSIVFTASVSGGIPPYTFSWMLGDGATGTGNPVSHTYNASRSFKVTLTVTDANGGAMTVSHIVGVFARACPTVSGNNVPVERLALLAPVITLVLGGLGVAVFYVKPRRRGKNSRVAPSPFLSKVGFDENTLRL